uniref:VIT family protein n=1 Tax=Fervidicoccus fontis TaxID=683846 RepID=A0A7J3ZL00_9CREN
MSGSLLSSLKELRRLAKVAEAQEIARRMFVTNSFDALLTSLGVMLGSYISGVEMPVAYIGAVLGGGLTMGVFSGFLGSFFSERAERLRELHELEEKILRNLKGTIYEKVAKWVPLYVAFWSSLGILVFPMLTTVPFVLAMIGVIGVKVALTMGVVIANSFVFVLGAYLGRISGESAVKTGASMLAVSLLATTVLVVISAIT